MGGCIHVFSLYAETVPSTYSYNSDVSHLLFQYNLNHIEHGNLQAIFIHLIIASFVFIFCSIFHFINIIIIIAVTLYLFFYRKFLLAFMWSGIGEISIHKLRR